MKPPCVIQPCLALIGGKLSGAPYSLPPRAAAMLADPRVLGAGAWVQIDSRSDRAAMAGISVFLAGDGQAEPGTGEAGVDVMKTGQDVFETGIPGVSEGLLSLLQDASGHLLPTCILDDFTNADGEITYVQVFHLRHSVVVTVGDIDNELDWILSDIGYDADDPDRNQIDPGNLPAAKICTLLVQEPASAHERVGLSRRLSEDVARFTRIQKIIAPATTAFVTLTGPDRDALQNLLEE